MMERFLLHGFKSKKQDEQLKIPMNNPVNCLKPYQLSNATIFFSLGLYEYHQNKNKRNQHESCNTDTEGGNCSVPVLSLFFSLFFFAQELLVILVNL